MHASLPATIDFDGAALTITEHNGIPWLTAKELAKALGYSQSKAVSKLYSRNAAEFTDQMTALITVVPSTGTTGVPTETRIFNARGCHLVAMFARTFAASRFRRWVLDVLEGLAAPTPTIPDREIRHRMKGIASGFLNGVRDAMKAGKPLPEWPAELDDEGMRIAMVADTLQSARWLISFDHEQRMRWTPVPWESMVLSPNEIVRVVGDPEGPVRRSQLAPLVGAVMKRLGA